MTTEVEVSERRYRAATFGRIVCGINASRADAEALAQAAALSGSDGTLELVCVVDSRGYGATEQANIHPARAETALDNACKQAKELGVTAGRRIEHGSAPWQSLAERAAGSDLIVLGTRGGSRASGVMLGSIATEAVHRAELPVLVARPSPGAPFPTDILLASDGSPESHRAAELAATIARVHGSRVTILTAGQDEPAIRRHEIAEQAVQLAQVTGHEPAMVSDRAPARDAIVEYARRERPSLVVIGSGGKLGLKALRSVSEHVTHHVPCSVLVARAR
jgi:nucleotide-binding universal stress UspA family protein